MNQKITEFKGTAKLIYKYSELFFKLYFILCRNSDIKI